MLKTLYWHDYETWGAKPSIDKPVQFAGIRTDEQLNIIGEPLDIFCQPSPDMLPHPRACLVTGISPQKALQAGVTEREFMQVIHRELAQPGTCGVGYNTIRFDDEVTRYGLYRNFYDPYEREWKNGNSRWDIIDMVRMTRALRPEGIEWPDHENGTPSFKLEHISAANGLLHESAHDALSDVYATIDVAKLIKTHQPQLFNYLYQLRFKYAVNKLIDIEHCKPLLHVSSMFPASQGCLALVAPLAVHPVNKNGVIVFDLSADPAVLFDLSSEQIRDRVFTAQVDLPKNTDRIPLKVVHLNKSPVLATPKLLDSGIAQRLNIDLSQCEQHWKKLVNHNLQDKIASVFAGHEYEQPQDPEQMLYSGFLPEQDKMALNEIRCLSGDALAQKNFHFEDQRLPELLFRYRARNFPESLTSAESCRWNQFCLQRITQYHSDGALTLEQLLQSVDELRTQEELSTAQLQLMEKLVMYSKELVNRLDMSCVADQS